jgi:hypothetical protein
MVQLAALIAVPGLSEYRVMLGAALTVGVTPVQVKEIVYQAVPYAGMGKVFDFLHATNDVLTSHGIELPLEPQSTTTPETRQEQGLAVQKTIVGADQVDAMYAGAPADTLQPSTPGPAENFTGDVRVQPLFAAEGTAPYTGAYVTFQRGARSAGHTHRPGSGSSSPTASAARSGRADRSKRSGPVTWCGARPGSSTGTAPHRTRP